ncbi:MAG: methyltransferase [Ignavibacteriaceae bacterium]|nr:MAG: methyltransferase [Ignavibacteriaceae bacterium]
MPEINLIHGDCMEGLKNTPDKFYDLAVVDPPYVVGANSGRFGRRKETSKSYSLKSYVNKLPEKDYFRELFRVSKNQIIWGANYYPQYLNHSGWIVWDKENEYNEQLSDCELAYQSFNKRVNIFRFRWGGFVKDKGSFSPIETPEIIHPNQKPLALYKWLLTKYAKQGDKILDTHLGSGSIAIACYDLGFDLTAFELDKDYFEAMIKRFENHKKQLTIDFPNSYRNPPE